MKAVFGPAVGCRETEEFAERLPYRVSRIVGKYGYNVDPEEITTPDGNRITSSSLEEGIAIPGVNGNRREIRRDIRSEICRMNVVFVSSEEHYRGMPSSQREILEFC